MPELYSEGYFPQPAVADLAIVSDEIRNDLVASFPEIARIGDSSLALFRKQPRG